MGIYSVFSLIGTFETLFPQYRKGKGLKGNVEDVFTFGLWSFRNSNVLSN